MSNYSEATAVFMIPSEFAYVNVDKLLIYPNPSTQFIRIEKQNEPFKIYELATSRLVLKGLIRSNQIDVTSLSPGHFYLQVGRSRIKFTKQK